MKLKILFLFLFSFTVVRHTSAQKVEEVVSWEVTENSTDMTSSNHPDVITVLFHGSTLKLLLIDTENKKVLDDMNILKFYIDQTERKDTTYVCISSPVHLIQKKNQKVEEGYLYLNLSNTGEIPDIIKLDFPGRKKVYQGKAVQAEMRYDLLALALISTNSILNQEGHEIEK